MKHLKTFEALTEKEERRLKSLKSELAITTSWVKYDKIEDEIKELEAKKEESDETVNESNDVNVKVNELIEELNNIKDLDATIQHKEAGNGLLLKVELTLNGNLKKLTPETLSAILQKFNGYIEGIEYKENTNKIIIMFKTFEHKL